jgi:hypothetical protein
LRPREAVECLVVEHPTGRFPWIVQLAAPGLSGFHVSSVDADVDSPRRAEKSLKHNDN